MIRVLAIDDEPLALEQLSTYIQNTPFMELVAACKSALEATTIMRDNKVDALFIDINMPDKNGIDFIRSLDEPPIVVFSTAYGNYAIDGYKVNAVDFLLKPYEEDEFLQAALKVKRKYELLQSEQTTKSRQASLPSPETEKAAFCENDSMFIKTERRMVRINVADIRFIEGMSEYVKIHTKTGERPFIVLQGMKRMEEQLPSSLFLRIHRSFIVNLKAIQEVNKNSIVLDDKTYLPIGDLYKSDIFKYVLSKQLGK